LHDGEERDVRRANAKFACRQHVTELVQHNAAEERENKQHTLSRDRAASNAVVGETNPRQEQQESDGIRTSVPAMRAILGSDPADGPADHLRRSASLAPKTNLIYTRSARSMGLPWSHLFTWMPRCQPPAASDRKNDRP
jgi:hypothetical protein